MSDTSMTPTSPDKTLYQQVAERVEALIEAGTLPPGARIPSVRKLSRQLSVSVTTVLEAYRLLEDRRLVEARPQSGYYVRPRPSGLPEPEKTESSLTPVVLDTSDLVMRIAAEGFQPGIVPLGAGVPSAAFLPTARLGRFLAQAVRRHPGVSHQYGPVSGDADLRVQIARRALEGGCSLRPEDIVTTAGAQEAVHLCLRAVTKPGDTVAVETPTYYGLLEALECLHLKALEIATDPREGVCLRELRGALEGGSVAAVVLTPTHGNPLGHTMADDKKAELVALLAERGIPLIEDDVYGELPFGDGRPRTAKAFDTAGGVLLCSSFSKTLAPGYRIGWTAPGRYGAAVRRLKFASSVATASPTQMAVAAFLGSGGYDRYLRRLCHTYENLARRMAAAVGEYFPEGTRVSRPSGGHFLWVEMPDGVDSLRLHEAALEVGVSIVPGPLFSATGRYLNCMRLNCAVPWTDRVEQAMRDLGRLASEAARAG